MSISYWWAWSHCQNVCCPNLAFILAWRFLCRCTLYHYLPCLSFFWLPEQKESLIQVDHSDQQQLRKSYGSVVFFFGQIVCNCAFCDVEPMYLLWADKCHLQTFRLWHVPRWANGLRPVQAFHVRFLFNSPKDKSSFIDIFIFPEFYTWNAKRIWSQALVNQYLSFLL